MRRRLGQGNLVEGLIGPEVGKNKTLDRIAELLDWAALEAVLADIYAAPGGRPSYSVGLLLRALLLQAWHGLSDPAAEGGAGGSAELPPLPGRGPRRADA